MYLFGRELVTLDEQVAAMEKYGQNAFYLMDKPRLTKNPHPAQCPSCGSADYRIVRGLSQCAYCRRPA